MPKIFLSIIVHDSRLSQGGIHSELFYFQFDNPRYVLPPASETILAGKLAITALRNHIDAYADVFKQFGLPNPKNITIYATAANPFQGKRSEVYARKMIEFVERAAVQRNSQNTAIPSSYPEYVIWLEPFAYFCANDNAPRPSPATIQAVRACPENFYVVYVCAEYQDQAAASSLGKLLPTN